MNARTTLLLQWLVARDFCVYLRPHNAGGDYVWRVTAEKMGRQLIYEVFEDEDLNVAVITVYRQVRKKLGIKKTRKRARSKK